MANGKQVNDLIDAIRESGVSSSRIQAAISDLVFECKAKEAAMINRSLDEALKYLIDFMGPRLSKNTVIGIASRK